MKPLKKSAWLAITFIVLVPPSVWSDTVGSLNTFNPGETARSSEVNANFSEIESAVNSNDSLISGHETRIADVESQVVSGIPGQLGDLAVSIDFLVQEIEQLNASVSRLSAESQEQQAEIDELARTKAPSVLDGNYELIGAFLGGSPEAFPDPYQGITGQVVRNYVVLSKTDYMFEVALIDGTIKSNVGFQQSGVYFSGPGCQGQAYATDIPPSGLAQGYVFQSRSNVDPTTTYYVEPDSEYVDNPGDIRGSAYLSSGCQSSVASSLDKVPVFPNDPEITGVTGEAYPTPIRIGRP